MALAQKKLRVTLHIGSTKTGSSALQKLLFANRHALQEASVLYPDVGIASNAHHVLLAAIHPGAWKMHEDAYDVPPADYFVRGMEEALRQAAETGCDHLVISSEYLWGEFPPRVYKQLQQALNGCNVRIFASVRDQAHWRESTYLQNLKAGEKRGFAQWLEHASQMPARGFDFDQVLKKWIEGVNATSATIVRYEFDDMDDYMEEVFFQLTGVTLSAMPHQLKGGTENPSPTREGMKLILDLNRSGLPPAERQAKLRNIMKSHSRAPNTKKLYFPKQHQKQPKDRA